MANRPHKKLDAWKKAIELTVETYRSTEKLTAAERFGLVSQMRRAAVSVKKYRLPFTDYRLP